MNANLIFSKKLNPKEVPMNKIQITSWENATLANRFMFYKIFTNNPDKCKRLLEILLHMEIERIESPYGEANFEVDFDSKGINAPRSKLRGMSSS
ncbi:MAG TPA: hypothetical protein DCZ76_10605 [Treponema sp.]|nr:hypothetical protein [Treponema sp.]